MLGGRRKVEERLPAGRVSELPPPQRPGQALWPWACTPHLPTLLRRQLRYRLLFIRIFGGFTAHLYTLPACSLREVFGNLFFPITYRVLPEKSWVDVVFSSPTGLQECFSSPNDSAQVAVQPATGCPPALGSVRSGWPQR